MTYTSVDTSTLAGLQRAEKLVARGWEIYYTGLFYVKLRKPGRSK